MIPLPHPQGFPSAPGVKHPSFCIGFSSTLWVPTSHPTFPVECLPSALRSPPEALRGGECFPTSAPGQLSPSWRAELPKARHGVGVGDWILRTVCCHKLPYTSDCPTVPGSMEPQTNLPEEGGGGRGGGIFPASSNILLHVILSKSLQLSSDHTNETAGWSLSEAPSQMRPQGLVRTCCILTQMVDLKKNYIYKYIYLYVYISTPLLNWSQY